VRKTENNDGKRGLRKYIGEKIMHFWTKIKYVDCRKGGGRKLTHELKDEIDIFVVLSAYNIVQSNDVWMISKLLQEHDLSERPLGICLVTESIEDLLQCDNLARFLIDRLPNNAVRLRSKLNFKIIHNISKLLPHDHMLMR